MKAVISYNEITEFIRENYNWHISLRMVDSKTLALSFKLLAILPEVTVRFHIEVQEDNVLKLTFEDKEMMSLMLRFASKFIDVNCQQVMTVNTVEDCVIIDLGRVVELEKLLERVRLSDVEFEPENVVVTVGVKRS